MKIWNVRLGFATNSSSSHSLIFLSAKDRAGLTDDLSETEMGRFGWENFTLVTEAGKRAYLGAQIYTAMRAMTDSNIAISLANAWAGSKLDIAEDSSLAVYVDHQSVWDLPLDWAGKGLDLGFLSDLKAHLLRDDVVVLGGNDNSDGHPLHDAKGAKSANFGAQTDVCKPHLSCRKDGAHWVLFSRENGAKYRVTFDPDAKEPVKALTPELVDIKITDYCPFANSGGICGACYQGSDDTGKHASRESLSAIAHTLAEAQVFEVALGGGEPTFHPDFVQYLEELRGLGVMPNFTTKNLAWLREPVKAKRILDSIGGFAYSASSAKDVRLLDALITTLGYDPDDRSAVARDKGLYMDAVRANKVAVQIVPEALKSHDFRDILKACAERGLKVTLLGFKETGRGAGFAEEQKKLPAWNDKRVFLSDDWLSVVKEFFGKREVSGGQPRVSIDTSLAKSRLSDLKKAKIPEWCYQTEEGKFSMYIDAVKMRVGASSYVPEKDMRVLKNASKESVLEAFGGW